MTTEKMIPGTDAWWDKWSDIVLPLVRLEGPAEGILFMVRNEDCRREIFALLQQAAQRPEFWSELQRSLEEFANNSQALNELADRMDLGMSAMRGIRASKPPGSVN